MKYVFIFVLILLNLGCQSDKIEKAEISPDVSRIVERIAEINELMGEAVGYAGERPEQYDNFIELRNIATPGQLLTLTDHTNAVVRCYSFWALSYDSTVELLPIIVAHLQDNELVSSFFGCILYDQKVGDFFIDVVTPQMVDLDNCKLDSSQTTQLDSILIFTSNSLAARAYAINRARPFEYTYSRLRQLFLEENDQFALVALAKYGRQEDITLILNNRANSEYEESGFGYTYEAIFHFPHRDFFPLLRANLEKTLDNTHFSNEWRGLYRAIAAYRNQEALELLKVPFSRVQHEHLRGYHLDYVFLALEELRDSLYDDLLWQLWEDENRMNPRVFKYLESKSPERAFALTKESLYKPNTFTDTVIALMMDYVLLIDSTFAVDIMRRGIALANVNRFEIYSERVADIRDTAFVEPLFQRLQCDANPHVCVNIVKALLAYDNEFINARAVSIVKTNTRLMDSWGREAIKKLFSEKHVSVQL